MQKPTFNALGEYFAGTKTVQQLGDAWNQTYLPSVRQDYLQPLLAKMEAAKAEYLNTFLDVAELIRHVDELHGRVESNLASSARLSVGHSFIPKLIQGDEIKGNGMFVPEHMHDLQERAHAPYLEKRMVDAFGIARVTEWEEQ